jgi:Flp pilus assembly protein TadD
MKRFLVSMLFCSLFQVGCSQLSPEDGEQNSLIRAGDRIQAAGDPSSAISIYESALQKNPAHKLPLYLKLGEAYMNAGRIDDARKIYEEALPFDEEDEVKKQLGRLYLSTGKPDEAISIFEGIILVHKDDIKVFNGLGVAHDLKGEHQVAQDYYHKALSINSESDEIKSNLGLSLAFEGKYEEALNLLRPIGEGLGATSKQRHNLALVYGLAGDHSKAEEIFSKDMSRGDVNENIHAIRMVPKPKIIPPKVPIKEVQEAEMEKEEE